VKRGVERALVERLMTLAAGAPMPQVRALAASRLARIAKRLGPTVGLDDAQVAHHQLLAADIERFTKRPAAPATSTTPPAAPPGAPIGAWGAVDDPWCGAVPDARRASFFRPLFAPPADR
jgi:hypothetical protein